MKNKLAALSDEAIFKLKAQVDEAAESRKRRLMVPGKQVTFTSHKTGETLRLMITGRGPKNIAGYLIHPDGRHDRFAKWRVCPELAMPFFPPPAPIVTAPGGGTDRPASTSSLAF